MSRFPPVASLLLTVGLFLGLAMFLQERTAAPDAPIDETTVQPAKPVVDGPEGAGAFDDLSKHYQDPKAQPPVEQAIQNLESADAIERAKSGKYLFALLAQSLADETNGRAAWHNLPYWGGDAESDARLFRQSLAPKLAAKAKAPEILDAAVWLIREDRLAENQKAGLTLLFRIQSPRSTDTFRVLLAPPHPSQAVLVAVLDEVGRRKLTSFQADVRPLCVHYRTAVRTAARNAAGVLGVRDLPEYRPEEAFAPWLDNQLRNIAKMVEGGVPKNAKWAKFTVTYPKQGRDYVESFQGWLLSDGNEHVEILDLFGRRLRHAKPLTKIEPSTLQDQAKALVELRTKPAKDDEYPLAALSRQGMLTGQFEASFISAPEALVAAWLYQRGDKRLTAELLFPRIEAADDDRWLREVVLNLLGNTYHLEMLDAFSERDYDRTIRLARHLARPIFDGYVYQDRAKQLANQLAKRADDFKAFRLPTPDEWTELKQTLTRKQQIEYMAARLRLLNCEPNSSFEVQQTATPKRGRTSDAKLQEVVNPYVELRQMAITIGELPALVPFLADESFMPSYCYWRSFHPSRDLYRVNWAVAKVINNAADRDLAQFPAYTKLDRQGRRRHLDAILDWCRRNADKTQEELLLDTLATVDDGEYFRRAVAMAALMELTDALPVAADRFEDFPQEQGYLVSICYRWNAAKSVPYARKWLNSKNQEARFWSALILLGHGNQSQLEGLATMEDVLAEDGGSDFYPVAIIPLLELRNERATMLACGILKKGLPSSQILQMLFLAGRQECLDYLLAKLDSETPHKPASDAPYDSDVARPRIEGDLLAEIVEYWRPGHTRFDLLAPDSQRRANRQELKSWLKEQFAQIKAGRKPTMAIEALHVERRTWRVNTP